jgi:DNA-binding protein HU-beta
MATNKMSKSDLVQKISEEAKISKKQANTVINVFVDSITDALCKGEKVSFVGFGTFSTVTRKARKGINPMTRKEILIPAQKAPVFKAGATLKNFVKALG